MSEYKKIIPIANQILKKHELCDHCLGRLFSKQLHLSSNKVVTHNTALSIAPNTV